VVAVGDSTGVADMLQLPVGDPLVDDKGKPLPGTRFYIPGSVLNAQVDTGHPLAFGVGASVPLFFDSSPVFTLPAGGKAMTVVASFDSANPLLSGWAFGQAHLKGADAIVDACVGKGHLFLMGPEVNQGPSRTRRSSSCSTGSISPRRTARPGAAAVTAGSS